MEIEDAVVVLNDGETFSSLERCHVAYVQPDEDPGSQIVAYDLGGILSDPAVHAVMDKYRVSASKVIKDVIIEELLED